MSLTLRKASLVAAALVVICLSAATTRTADATFPGRPGVIVFNMITFQGDGREFTGGLYVIRPGQKRPRQLTKNRFDYDPSFAPSGQKLVFRRVSDSGGGIYTLNIRSGNAKRLTTVGGDLDPAFGPSGTIVFSRFVNESGYDLFLRNPNGRLRQLTSNSGRDREAVFTPDGERIVFRRDYRRVVPFTVAEGGPPEGLYSIRIDGTGLRAIKRGARPRNFDISPDGQNFVFGSATEIYPAYSPAGSKIAYTNYEGLWIRRADESGSPKLVLATDYRPYEAGGALVIQPAWQPLP
ncbi:MAG TPA: hypothetical protein VGV69_06605 [Solirubrobacterales bacterium]|nr:hypothetical protein [Solirubrobacterales bacterium]